MLKQWRWLMLVLTGLTLFGTVLYLYLNADQSSLQDNSVPNNLFVAGHEPITPIPLDLKLDARKVALGRRLFYDPQLSSDNTISCAHCHNLTNGGMDSLPRSFGIGGKEGLINTPTVFNSGFNFRQFWDGRATSLEEHIDFPNSPIVNSCDMGASWDEIVAKLDKGVDYRRDFAAIYPEDIRASSVKDAIATFERSLITPNGKFDRYLRGDKNALDNDELIGYLLFKNLGCVTCHQGMNVGGNMYEKLGLFKNYFEHRGNVQEIDYGRYNVTHIEEHRYEFRVPPLRNVGLTAPYFHDASASTLEEAVAVMGEYQLGVDLSKDEIAKIVKFLNTLTGTFQEEPSK